MVVDKCCVAVLCDYFLEAKMCNGIEELGVEKGREWMEITKKKCKEKRKNEKENENCMILIKCLPRLPALGWSHNCLLS